MSRELTDDYVNYNGWHLLSYSMLEDFVAPDLLEDPKSIDGYKRNEQVVLPGPPNACKSLADNVVIAYIETSLSQACSYYKHGVGGVVFPSVCRKAFLDFVRSGRPPGNIWEEKLQKLVRWITYLRLTGQVQDEN